MLLLAACADPAGTGAPSSRPADLGQEAREEERLVRGGDIDYPPDIVVHAGGEALVLLPYTFCWGDGCADGMPPDPLPQIGAQPALTVEFPVDGWEFTASFQRAGDPCARTQSVELERVSPTMFALPPAGFADTYDVTLFGRGPGGDAIALFRWTTLSDGRLPVPQASLGILAEHDGEIDSYGVELSVSNLARSPDRVEATVTVTAAGGQSLTFTPAPATRAPDGCRSLEGALYWDGPSDQGAQAAQLGAAPFTYTVDLLLDGVAFRGTATWPDDLIPDYEPSASLSFTPALPALSAAGS